MLRDDGKNARRESHVEESVCLSSPLLQFLEMCIEVLERLVLVVLARDVSAELAEFFELLLNLLCRCFHVRLDSSKILLVIHLRTGISDNSHIFGEELVTVLSAGQRSSLIGH